MTLWTSELKKMFVYQKGLLFTGLFFVIWTGALIILDKPANPEIERNASSYRFYLDQVRGPYSVEKKQFLEEEAAGIAKAKTALQQATDSYYDGEMGEKEFLAASAQLEETLRNEKGFELIFDQYSYIREQPDNRYFLYTNGWDALLATDALDLLLMLLLLLLAAQVFCNEFESRMEPINLTVRKGAAKQAVCKIGLAVTAAVALCLVTAAMKYGFYSYKYGLQNGGYPLQSLAYFSTSPVKLTLLETYLAVTACKLLGYVFFTLLILFVSVWVRRYALTLFACTAMVLLPYYGFGLESTKYYMPGPLGFMVASGFFRGNEYKRNLYKEQPDIVFQAVPGTVWMLLTVTALLMSIGMFIAIRARSTNVWAAAKKSRMASPAWMLLIAAAVCGLTGCTPAGSLGERDVFNYSSSRSFENDRYRFYVDETDLENIRLMFEDKVTGAKERLVRSPMTSLTRIENTIYGNGPFVYYMKYDFDKSELREVMDRFSVIEVDTRTFTEAIVFEKNLNPGKSTLLRLQGANTHDGMFYAAIQAFFLDEHHLYFIGQDEIRRVNRLTGEMKVIIRCPVIRSVAFDGKAIYYVNEKSQVAKVNTETEAETVLPDIVTDQFILTETELLFVNRKDKQRLYALHLRDQTLRRMSDKPVLSFQADDRYIEYISDSDLKEYRISRDGSGVHVPLKETGS